MRRFILLSSLITFMLAVLGITIGIGLASASPFRPGNVFFPLQKFAEDKRSFLIFPETSRVSYYLDLADRRIVDLGYRIGSKYELVALQALEASLYQAIVSVADLPDEKAPEFILRLSQMTKFCQILFSLLEIVPAQYPDIYEASMAKIKAANSVIEEAKRAGTNISADGKLALNIPTSNAPQQPSLAVSLATIAPRLIDFPPGSVGAEHAFYPLVGNHASLQCESCHINGQYAATPNTCSSCHASVLPANHFSGDCATCHNPTSWTDIHFDHVALAVSDCQACHNRPAKHYSGQCSSCHTTNAWLPASFNHTGQTDCGSCHNRPANHYSGQCSSCHTTNAWLPASFNHTGQTDCGSCHNRPANHYSGQCSSCHTTNAWLPASFNHTGQTDCGSCHNRPANHYSGQCSSCHTTNAWLPASFNHTGQTDCGSCHNRPANHYSGQCSSCHTTNAWLPASFNHTGQTDCGSCHNRPANHYSGQCSTCHDTTSWSSANLGNHSFPIDHKGAGGVCSTCHPSGGSAYTCYSCHSKNETEKKHAEKDILDIASQCASCHPNGKD